jgi:hypothetical protein
MSELAGLARRAATLARERAAAQVRDGLRGGRRKLAWLWSHRPPAQRATALFFVAFVAVVASWAILAQARLPGRLPTALDWAAARALVERDARPGDAVAVAPAWAERAREILPASVAVLAQARFDREDLVGVRRLWLLSLAETPGLRSDAEVDLADRAARSEEPARLGAFEVTRYDLAFPTLPLAFLPDRLAHASVSLGDERCTPDGAGRFRCRDGVVELERSVREIGGVPRPCLSTAAATPLDAPLVLAFPGSRIGRTLQGHAGATVGAASAPVRVAVLLEDEEVGSAELASGGWAPFRIDTSRSAGQARRLSLVVTSPGPLSLCLDAVVLP